MTHGQNLEVKKEVNVSFTAHMAPLGQLPSRTGGMDVQQCWCQQPQRPGGILVSSSVRHCSLMHTSKFPLFIAVFIIGLKEKTLTTPNSSENNRFRYIT